MAEVIKMPRLSDTMTEGVIAAWHKKVGDPVKKGDLLAEIETDKATMELESYKEGTLLFVGGPDGSKLQVDDLLAIIGKEGEDISALTSGGSAPAQPAAEAPKEAATAPAAQQNQAAPAAASAAPALDLANMEEVVLMPRLSDTMTEGVIASWQKNVGDDVKKGDVLAEIETDKATMELESYKDGKLLYQGAPAGDKIEVNHLLAIIGGDGVDVDAIVKAAKSSEGGQAAPAAENAATAPKAAEEATAAPAAQTAPAAPALQEVVNEGRIFASPLAKKLAEEKGVDLKYVKGSGDNGRIVRNDVENYTPAATTATASASTAAAAQVPAGQESFEELPVSQMRKVIARRLAESKYSAPHFYLTMAINMDAAVAARPKLNKEGQPKISFNDIVLKAVAVALKKHPAVNSSWLGDKIRINHHVNIGVAVAVEDGLLVPVVRFADTKPLTVISQEVKTFAKKAKDKKLQPSDWEGSTFTVSNLGMFGIDQFTGIINPPDACILAVGGISQEPIVKDGQIVVGNIMKVTLSCDHRVVDGASGSAFLQTLKELLEEPLRMLL
ncbi:pyruvate dehydrogenase complex dihydrolipoamide acetyltransferase [Arachidicoccus ginsenosidivorans]|uniref:Acetyltransferase component of pyruvate dehydrogenase complex n=1 Tax=Arachidicoccus ginsenosidivorans TaxID=496057 RepID=A0A5B8VP50_9BACT|nr:pyruvate dehydrogenase complex dihydrolipoamide acetyltransferase [Arachidicoccus ginsenosidivorans]QEC72385.1 pyruvate dehydrogenase complex dihydrolipoamide acetyltransferase [Arachidicoccus ginsenosidivorans]